MFKLIKVEAEREERMKVGVRGRPGVRERERPKQLPTDQVDVMRTICAGIALS